MTMVAALALGTGVRIDSIILMSDSRLTRETHGTRSDRGQKLLNVCPNVFIGLAGDYRAMELLKKLSKVWNNRKSPQPYWRNTASLAMNLFSRDLQKHWSHNLEDTSLFFVMEDLTNRTRNLFVCHSPSFTPVPLRADLHLIGADEETQTQFRDNYTTQRDFIKPDTLDKQAIPMFSAMFEVYGETIGGSNVCYIFHSEGYRQLSHAMSPDDGQNWVADAHNGDGTVTRQVNGQVIETTTTDYDAINQELNKGRRW